MTESIKHGIVLLQIAKNATLPEVQFKAKQQSGNIYLRYDPKVKIFWKICLVLTLVYVISKTIVRVFQILWSSYNIWTVRSKVNQKKILQSM